MCLFHKNLHESGGKVSMSASSHGQIVFFRAALSCKTAQSIAGEDLSRKHKALYRQSLARTLVTVR